VNAVRNYLVQERYLIRTNTPGPDNPLAYLVEEQASGRMLGGFGAHFYRAWVFPLYTPAGFTVLQEFAYDHPYHNGMFVGQNPVVLGEGSVNFWATPPRRSFTDPLFSHIGRADAQVPPAIIQSERGVMFSLQSVWRDEHEQPVLDELRTVRFYSTPEATICDMVSHKCAAYGDLLYPQTKFGSIGVRVEPRLLPNCGGVILADGGRRGTAQVVHEQESDFVAYQRDRTGMAPFGLLLAIRDAGVRGPWFIRDYGMAMYNPTWASAVYSMRGETWSIALRAIAYDGTLSEERIQMWLAME
jgi:hypothetical protein